MFQERKGGEKMGKGREMCLDEGNNDNESKGQKLSLLNIVADCEIIQYNSI